MKKQSFGNKFLTAFAAAFLAFVSLQAEEKAARATVGKAADVKITIDDVKKADEAAKNKKAVMTQMMQLFLDDKPPAYLLSHTSKEAPADVKIIKGKDDMSTLIYRCRYVDPEYLTDALDAVVTDAGYVELVKKLGSETNEYSQIIVHDKAEKMDELKQILLALDVLQPQVLVEAQVIEVYCEQGAERDVKLSYQYYDSTYDTNHSLGFNLDSPVQNRSATEDQGGTLNFIPFTHVSGDGSKGQLSAAIRWLNTSTNARVLSAPNVIADQGAEATITTAEELPIPETAALSSSTNLSFKFKQVGVTLKITPKMINEKTVQLSVNPQVRSVLRYEAFKQDDVTSNIPVISVRSIDTRLTVGDGDIIMLGGLYNSEKSESLRKVPYLGDIPVLGDLINGRDSGSVDKQLLFLLKVHIIHPFKPRAIAPDETAASIHKTAEILEQSNKIFTNKPASEFVDVENLVNEEAKNRAERRQHFRSVLDFLYGKEKKESGKSEKTAPGK